MQYYFQIDNKFKPLSLVLLVHVHSFSITTYYIFPFAKVTQFWQFDFEHENEWNFVQPILHLDSWLIFYSKYLYEIWIPGKILSWALESPATPRCIQILANTYEITMQVKCYKAKSSGRFHYRQNTYILRILILVLSLPIILAWFVVGLWI